MGTSIKQWAGLNSYGKREDGTEPTHDELYDMLIDAIGLGALTRYLPASKEDLAAAYAEDRHLNNIPLKKWDNLAPIARHNLLRIGINSISLSDCVCLMKAAARRWVQE